MISRPIVDMVSKQWGFEKIIINSDKYCGKLLYLVKNKHTSLHYHKIKDETLYVHSGKVKVYCSEEVNDMKKVMLLTNVNPLENMEQITLNTGDAIRIFPMHIHQIYAVEDTKLYEFSNVNDTDDAIKVM